MSEPFVASGFRSAPSLEPFVAEVGAPPGIAQVVAKAIVKGRDQR